MTRVALLLAGLLVPSIANADGLICATVPGNAGTRIFAGCVNTPPLHPPPHIYSESQPCRDDLR